MLSGKLCGALTGGICLISLYAGRGPVEEKQMRSSVIWHKTWFNGLKKNMENSMAESIAVILLAFLLIPPKSSKANVVLL